MGPNPGSSGLFLDIALTSQCPLDCRYCSVEKKATAELGPGTWIRLIESFAGLRRIDLISLEGGEPLLRPDLPDILSASLDCAGEVKIVTSGVIPLHALPDRLLLHPRFLLEVSMDGPPVIHNFLRDQSWDRTWDFFQKALRQGIRIRLRSVVSRHNLRSLERWLEGLDETLASFGPKVGFSFDTLLDPNALADREGECSRSGLRPYPTRGLLPAPMDMWNLFWNLKRQRFNVLEIRQTEPIRGCGTGRSPVISLDPSGIFSFCCEAGNGRGSVIRHSPEEVLHLLEAAHQDLPCPSCVYFQNNLCQGCCTGEKCGMVRHWGAKDCKTLHGWMIDARRSDQPSAVGVQLKTEKMNWG